jgi:RNA-directed DNA polymerase
MMYGRGKSDSVIVAEKPTKKAGATRCGVGGAKGGRRGEYGATKHAPGTGPRKRVPSVGPHTRVARQRKKEKFTALLHYTSAEHLEAAFFELKENAAPGVDGLTWGACEAALDHNLADLHSRLDRGAYRALPSRRIYIPKPDGRQRLLAVAALEDKIVQRGDHRGAERDLRQAT